jgi:flagellar basal body-associated protein FliL
MRKTKIKRKEMVKKVVKSAKKTVSARGRGVANARNSRKKTDSNKKMRRNRLAVVGLAVLALLGVGIGSGAVAIVGPGTVVSAYADSSNTGMVSVTVEPFVTARFEEASSGAITTQSASFSLKVSLHGTGMATIFDQFGTVLWSYRSSEPGIISVNAPITLRGTSGTYQLTLKMVGDGVYVGKTDSSALTVNYTAINLPGIPNTGWSVRFGSTAVNGATIILIGAAIIIVAAAYLRINYRNEKKRVKSARKNVKRNSRVRAA